MQHSLRKAAGQRPAPCAAWIAALVLLVTTFALKTPAAVAQHVTNPYAGATQYVSPDWTNEVKAAAATEPAGSTLANQMTVVGTYPTAVWLDHIGAIYGGAANSGRMSLQAHINAALAQQSGTGKPIVVTLVIYDLPDRDCAALASNGELSLAGGDTVIGPGGTSETLTGTGLQEYESDYITPIYNILQPYASNSNIRFVLVVEDDSLPNMITNTGESPNPAIANCVAANDGITGSPSLNGVYVQAIQYALNTFHQLPNVYNYLDVAHHGWLGWPNNFQPGVNFLTSVAKGTTAGVASVDGFITNTANYGPTKEPYMTATESVGSGQVFQATFYQFDPYIDEEDYAAALDAAFIQAGFPSTLGFLIDTSRNGWGGPTRPSGPSTSTDLNTFVNATKIDGRDDMGQWCNQPNAGIGVPPTVNPGGFANLSAYVWIKPPGESDGNYPGSVYNGVTSTTGDPNCNPTHDNALANNQPTNAVANSPKAGTFWIPYFTMLVQNAFPVLPSTTAPGFTIAASGASVEQGTSATDSVTISSINGFNGTVALSVSGLPTGVTASFSPSSVTGSAGSTLTFTASNTATVGAATVTVTGTSGSTTETTTLTLNVTAEPNFTISVSPTSLSVPPNTNPTATITVNFVGGLTGSVSLSAANLPSGVSANFAPSSLNSSGTVTVNFFAQANTPAGTTNISLVGTDGSITHSATLALTTGSGTAGFTLAASPTSVSLTQGSTAADTITVTDTGGFTGAVTLSASGLPSGVTATFGTNPTTGSSVVTFTASSSATPGAYTVTINGASGSTTASTSISLSVASQSQGSFTLKPSAATLSAAQGASGTDTISVSDVSPFSGSVTFAASGLPTGVTASFSPASSATSSVLTLSVGSSVAAGNYPITITGTSGTLTASTSITLTVTSTNSGNYCHVVYTIGSQWISSPSGFGAGITIQNTGTANWTSWTLTWSFANGQTVTQLWNGTESQSGANVTVSSLSYNGSIPAGGSYNGMGFNGTWNGTTNSVPTAFAVNGHACN